MNQIVSIGRETIPADLINAANIVFLWIYYQNIRSANIL